MPVHPYFPGATSSGISVEDLMLEMPEREVFVKDTDGSMTGTGMRLLPDGKLLAPDGFSVESGSIDFGDVITLSESAGFLGLRNNLNDEMYQFVDYHVPRDAVSDSPRIFQLIEPEWFDVAQADTSTTLTANPLIFNYTTVLNARTNSITFKSTVAMNNVRIKVTKSDVNVAIKYLPSKSSWTIGTGGYNFIIGDNTIDFKDSPVPLTVGTMLTFEIRASNISLQGSTSGIPYFGVMTQRGEYQDIPLSIEVSPEAIRDKLETLASPDKLSKTAIQDAVLSVNGQFGDVTISTPTQVQSDWNQATTSALDYIKNKPTIPAVNYPVVSVNTKTGDVILSNTDVGAAAAVHTHAISDTTGLQTALNSKYNNPVGSTSQYLRGDGSLSTFPSIPATQVNTDWNSISGVSQLLNKPTLFSGAYADLTGKPVLFSGNYADLAAKPALFDGTWASLTGKPTTFTPSAHTHVISDVTGLQTALDGKFAIPAGATSQYVRGNGTLATLPLIPTTVSSFTNDSGYLTSVSLAGYRKTETFLGTTDASGNYSITFANSYATAPDIQPQIIGGTFNQMVRVVSVSTTGCVVQAAQRNLVTLLAIEVLLGATVNLVGASVTVQVTARA